MLRWHFTFNKDEMARWLGRMDRQGWQLTRTAAGLCFFEPTTPGTYDYQIDYAAAGPMDPAYRDLLRDMGVEIVCRWGPWIVLRRSAQEGPFELYSDAASRAEHLGRMLRFFKIMAAIELAASLTLLMLALETHIWWMIAVCVLGFAAAAGMISRVYGIRREIELLTGRSSAGPDLAARWLVAAGALCICIGVILSPEGLDASVPDILKGAGLGLCILAVFRLLTSGRERA